MPHGAPDHTRLSDDAFSHYRYYSPTAGNWLIVALDERSLIDIPLVGVLGDCYMVVDNNDSFLMVTIDGTDVFFCSVKQAFEDRYLYKGGLDNVISVTVYDEVNDHYGLCFNPNWKIYIHNTLKIYVNNATVFPCTVDIIQAHYLEYR